MTKTRLIVFTLCLVLLAGLLVIGRNKYRGRQKQEGVAAVSSLSNADCRTCHDQIWQEWEESYHSRSWEDPNVKAAFQHFGNDRQCQSCHAPDPVFHAGLASPITFRKEDRESGVNCLSCHAVVGGVAAGRTIPDAPCHPIATPQLSTSAVCAGCHKAIHDDWKESSYAQDGKTCQACHMTVLDGDEVKLTHICLGGHDDRLVRSGVIMKCDRKDSELVVSVTNHATGHNFPGERHNRVLLLEVIEYRSDGAVTLAQQTTIKDITPFRGESSADRIRAGETIEVRFPIVDQSASADVRLLYKLFPWYTERDALVIDQETLEFE